MNLCRICLGNQSVLFSVNDSVKSTSCAAIISSISDVKIMKGSNDMICLSCRKTLMDFYEFKLLIERSDLRRNKLMQVYRLNNDEDKVDSLPEINKKELNNVFNCNSFIKNNGDYIHYNSTFITKVTKDMNKFSQPVVSVKSETNENISIESSENETKLVFKDYNYKKKNELKCKEHTCCIKPIFQNDLRVIKTYIPKNRIRGKTKMQAYSLREDLCPYCGKKTKAIRSHILQHTAERKFSCNNCKRTFYTKRNLETHIKTHFIDEKFKCDHCIASFVSKGALARHMIAHTDVREFICKICKKTFKWKRGLHRHMLTHNFAKRFMCEMCTMSFATKYAFQHHYRVHTGERPYKCELCSQPYSYKRDFNRHCLKKHGVFVDRRPVNIMNEEVLKREKILMKDLILRLHGIKTEKEPLDYFQGPQGALAFAKAVKVMKNKEILIDVHL